MKNKWQSLQKIGCCNYAGVRKQRITNKNVWKFFIVNQQMIVGP